MKNQLFQDKLEELIAKLIMEYEKDKYDGNKFFNRTKILLGNLILKKILDIKILILGLGDVGGICLEMLVRAGINEFVLVDYDKSIQDLEGKRIVTELENFTNIFSK